MPGCADQTRPMRVSHVSQTRRRRGEEIRHLAALQLASENDLALRINSVDLKHAIAEIKTSRENLYGDGSLPRGVTTSTNS